MFSTQNTIERMNQLSLQIKENKALTEGNSLDYAKMLRQIAQNIQEHMRTIHSSLNLSGDTIFLYTIAHPEQKDELTWEVYFEGNSKGVTFRQKMETLTDNCPESVKHAVEEVSLALESLPETCANSRVHMRIDIAKAEVSYYPEIRRTEEIVMII